MRRRVARRLAIVFGGLLLVAGLFEVLGRSLSKYPPLFYAPDPIRIWRVAPAQSGWPRRWLPRATVDARGYRRASPAPAGARGGIVVVGDSVTFGWGVEDGEEFPARLEVALNAARTRLRQPRITNFNDFSEFKMMHALRIPFPHSEYTLLEFGQFRGFKKGSSLHPRLNRVG